MTAERTPVTGTFTGVAVSSSFVTRAGFNISLQGFGVATVLLQRSFDRGVNWGTVAEYTANAEQRCDDVEMGVEYRLNCTSYTSGTIPYRLSS